MEPCETYSNASSRLSSPLTSLASRSPSPPSEFEFTFRLYPTPPSSDQSSQESSPAPDDMSSKRSLEEQDDSQPTKKRKMSQPKPRTTQHLNLESEVLEADEKAQLDKLLKVLYKKRKIVVVAGAGISVSAGIPDFRSSTGLFKTLKGQHKLKSSGKDLFDASVYKDDKSTTQFHDMVRNLSKMSKGASPTPFHHLLATLATEGRLLRLFSQNVDSLDIQIPPLATQTPLPTKGPWPKTILLHGGLEKMVCSKCHALSDFDAKLFKGPHPPACNNCVEADDVRTNHAGKRSHGVGRLRPRMVLYHEHNPDDEAIGKVVSADLRTRPDALIVVGTTLKVPGVKRIVKEMCGVVRGRRDGVTVWINKNPPPPGPGFEWDLIVNGPCDRVADLADMPKWDEKVGEAVTAEDGEKICSQNGGSQHMNNEVVVSTPVKPKTFERIQGVMTPVASPPFSPITMEKQPDRLLPPANLPTPSKAPTKPLAQVRKPGVSKPVKLPKTTKPKAAAPKKPGPKSKKPAVGNAKISASFKVSKAAAAAPAAKTKVAAFPGVGQFQANAPPQTPPHSSVESQPMQPVSPGAARNNSSPPFKAPSIRNDEWETHHREGSIEWIAEQLKQDPNGPKTPERHQTPEERKEIYVPTVSSPSLQNILNGY